MVPEWLGLAVSGAAISGWLVLMVILGIEGRLTVLRALVLLALAGPFILAVWLLRRALRVGLYVRPAGLRVQDFLRSRTFPWRSIGAVESRSTRVGLILPIEIEADFIWVVPREGQPVRTPLRRFGGGLIGYSLNMTKDLRGCRLLDWETYDRTLLELQEQVRAGAAR
ncbi:PH domain-containing protein [Virgisporangium aurantiacum]|uniref:PH domain-containing protein n=1 Tax=Virgisporangium aurantiacum TaxID=175570 RepID=A0A8J4E7A5_9ACTN|nr:PH domain-containing protein [Virgisporangium aurantiacum]GIJ64915.1 hypothetical protein Vau01_124310 [Virgisporangium aurantiacum]